MPKKQKTRKTQPKKKGASRPPVVVVLGHIDHGKTSLLDYIRKARVAQGESGGITQSIGAYVWESPDDSARKITFIDTPGHAAFSKMRQRGASVADIAILVVAADDGVKPQTVEAIAHAKAADVPLVVALNKMDIAPKGAVVKVKGQLVKEGVGPEDQGGKVPVVAVSAKTGDGVDELLEVVGLMADLLELKSNPAANLKAVVIESSLSPRQGPLATIVVKEGTLKVGTRVFADRVDGKVKALTDDVGSRLSKVEPGFPVQVLGFSDVPPVGSLVASEGLEKPQPEAAAPVQSRKEDLNIVLRTDTEGSLEAVSSAISALEVEDKKANLLLKGVGSIGDSDVRLAATASGLILGFNVPVISSAAKLADDFGVGVRSFTIIYELLEAVEKLLAGVHALEEEKKPPEAEVLKVFTLHSGDVVGGVKVLNGKFKYRDRIKVLRDDEEVHQGRIRGLRVGKDDVSKIGPGKEAGILIKPAFEFKKGDRLVIDSS